MIQISHTTHYLESDALYLHDHMTDRCTLKLSHQLWVYLIKEMEKSLE